MSQSVYSRGLLAYHPNATQWEPSPNGGLPRPRPAGSQTPRLPFMNGATGPGVGLNSSTYGTPAPANMEQSQSGYMRDLSHYAGRVMGGAAAPQRQFGITGDQQRHVNASAMGLPPTYPGGYPQHYHDFVQRAMVPKPQTFNQPGTNGSQGAQVYGLPAYNNGLGGESKYVDGNTFRGSTADGNGYKIAVTQSPTGGLALRGTTADGKAPLKIAQEDNARFRAFQARLAQKKQADADSRVLRNMYQNGLPPNLTAVHAALARLNGATANRGLPKQLGPTSDPMFQSASLAAVQPAGGGPPVVVPHGTRPKSGTYATTPWGAIGAIWPQLMERLIP